MRVDAIISNLQKILPKISAGEIDEASGFSRESICLQNAVVEANQSVFQASESNPDHKGMGTTIVVLQFYTILFL
jgi:serine/threonine protein phosphatase PrpC